MKVGDLVWKSVKAVAEGSMVSVGTPACPVGVLIEAHRAIGVPGGMVSVLWSHEGPGHRNDWLYRASVLEVINESR